MEAEVCVCVCVHPVLLLNRCLRIPAWVKKGEKTLVFFLFFCHLSADVGGRGRHQHHILYVYAYYIQI